MTAVIKLHQYSSGVCSILLHFMHNLVLCCWIQRRILQNTGSPLPTDSASCPKRFES